MPARSYDPSMLIQAVKHNTNNVISFPRREWGAGVAVYLLQQRATAGLTLSKGPCHGIYLGPRLGRKYISYNYMYPWGLLCERSSSNPSRVGTKKKPQTPNCQHHKVCISCQSPSLSHLLTTPSPAKHAPQPHSLLTGMS